MTIVIDKPAVLAGLRHAVAVKGADYVYQSPPESPDGCVYVAINPVTRQLRPSCVAGWALHHAGVSLGHMFEAANEAEVNVLAVHLGTERYGGYIITPAALECLRQAQRIQDAALDGFDTAGNIIGDCSWGAALAAAEGQP